MDRQEHLELYKLYVEMADRISERRSKANRFYMTLLSGLLVIISFISNKDGGHTLAAYQFVIFLTIGTLGLLVCLIWYFNLISYRQLNTGKFKVIHEMEEGLSLSPYQREWEVLGNGKNSRKYLQLTKVEALIPVILTIPYLIIITYSMNRLI